MCPIDAIMHWLAARLPRLNRAMAVLLAVPALAFGQAERLDTDAESGRLSGRLATGLVVPPVPVRPGETVAEGEETPAAQRRREIREKKKMADRARRRREIYRKKKDVASGNR